jgi:aminocarboxymuconate-semialdehyde decarboxylase
MPPFEMMTKNGKQAEEYAKIVNDGFAELCAQYPDHFPGWVAQCPMTAPDVGVREAARAMKMGALGVQIYTNVAGKPLDNPEFDPFWKAMNKTKTPIWLHPSRGAAMADYPTESKSKYEIWWTLGWSYETAAAMSRLVFSRIMDKYPNLKIITHHFGGIVPMLEGRIGPGWDQIGARTSDEDLQKVKKSLKKRPLNYFKENFYADTAVFGGGPATVCGLEFYQKDKIVFASDCPFDPEKGTYYIRETLKILDGIDMPKKQRKAIMHGNLEKLTGRKLA